MKNRNLLALSIIFMFVNSIAIAQKITKQTNFPVSDAVCPATGTQYIVSRPTGFSSCTITWTVTNGQKQSESGNTVTVVWNDTPGATGTVTATFTNCTGNETGNNNKKAELSELILSIKNQSFGSYINSANIDFCNTQEVTLTIPRMYVQGTGGIAQPPRVEVTYGWTLPAGWKDKFSNATVFQTPGNSVTIVRTKCAVPGIVKVEGILIRDCGTAANSAPATISLNGANPAISIGPQPGYTGGSACNTAPVNFTATINASLGCVSNYTWEFPTSWKWRDPADNQLKSSPVTTTANIIALTPDGTANISQPIKVSANFSCGTTITSGTYTPPFNAPQISASSIICSSGTSVLLTNTNSNAQVNWVVSSNMTIVSGQGTPTVNIKAINSTIKGDGVINASIVSCPNVLVPSKSIWVGKPNFVKPIEGPSQLLIDYSGQYRIESAKGAINSSVWTIEPNWSVYASGPSGGFQSATIVASSPTIKKLTITSSNTCGSESSWKYVEGVTSCNLSVSTYPNPSKGGDVVINIVPPPGDCGSGSMMASTSSQTENGGILLLRNSQGEKVLEKQFYGTSTELRGLNLKSGLYFIKVKYQGKTSEDRILIE